MPIKGLSERRRMPRLGKIRTGIKVQGKKSEYPKAVDYFVLPDDEYGKKLAEVFGDKPRELRIVFPVGDVDVIFPQWYKAYKSGVGLYCKGDGETASRVADDGKLCEVSCPCEMLESKKCKQMGNLVFMIPEVSLSGVFQVDTSSFNSIIDLNSGLDFVRSVRGTLAMSPCILRLSPREVSPDGKKKIVYTMTLAAAEGEAKESVLLSIGEQTQPVAALEGPKEDLGTGEVEETDLVPATIVDSVNTETGEVIDDEPVFEDEEVAASETITAGEADSLLAFIKKIAKSKNFELKKLVADIGKKYKVTKLTNLTPEQADDCELTLRAWESE